MCYIFGRFFLLRGGKEIALLDWNYIKFDKYNEGIDDGINYMQLTIEKDKIYDQVSLIRPTIDPKKGYFEYTRIETTAFVPTKYYNTTESNAHLTKRDCSVINRRRNR